MSSKIFIRTPVKPAYDDTFLRHALKDQIYERQLALTNETNLITSKMLQREIKTLSEAAAILFGRDVSLSMVKDTLREVEYGKQPSPAEKQQRPRGPIHPTNMPFSLKRKPTGTIHDASARMKPTQSPIPSADTHTELKSNMHPDATANYLRLAEEAERKANDQSELANYLRLADEAERKAGRQSELDYFLAALKHHREARKNAKESGRQAGTSYEGEAGTIPTLPTPKDGRPVGTYIAFITSPDGEGAGTQTKSDAKSSSEGRWAGTSITINGRPAGTSYEPKAGTSQDGRQAGVSRAWKQGRHPSQDGGKAGTQPPAGATSSSEGRRTGTPLQEAGPYPTDRWNDPEAGTSAQPNATSSVDDRWTGTSEVTTQNFQEGEWSGTLTEFMDRKRGRYISRLIAQKRGR